MKVVVMGGSGVVGSGVVEKLSLYGHKAVAASRRTGVDAVTGEGLDEALQGADVVIDVTNSPSFEDEAAQRFFETATRNILAAGAEAGVGHHIAISIVGSERLQANGYFRAKLAQERQVTAGSTPYTLLRATQFYEFLPAIVRNGATADEVRIAPARVQPLAADDAATALANLALVRPARATIELAGPDLHRLDQMVQAYMTATGDGRRVVADPQALYFGSPLTDETLMAGDAPRFGSTEFDRWLRFWVRDHQPT